MHVLVTGGAGFIGSAVVDALLGAGHEVRVLDNFATGKRENLRGVGGEVDLVEGDVQSYERVHTAVRGCDVVLHQAALPSVPRSIQDPLTSNAVNVTGGVANNAVGTVGNLTGGLLRSGALLDLTRAGLSTVNQTVNAAGQTVRQVRARDGGVYEVVTDTANKILSSRKL